MIQEVAKPNDEVRERLRGFLVTAVGFTTVVKEYIDHGRHLGEPDGFQDRCEQSFGRILAASGMAPEECLTFEDVRDMVAESARWILEELENDE